MNEYDLCIKNYSINDKDEKDESSSTSISRDDIKNTKTERKTNKKYNKSNNASSKIKAIKKKIFLLSKNKQMFKKSCNKDLTETDNESNNNIHEKCNEINESEYNIESESENNLSINDKKNRHNSASNLDLSLNEDKEAATALYDTSYLNLKQERLKNLEKEFLEKKRAKDSSTNLTVNKLNNDKKLSEDVNPISSLIRQTKTEIKIEKNRLSAKRSRDKQKKRLEDLESLTFNLSKENKTLREKSKKMEGLLSQYNFFVNNSLCKGCKDDFNKSYCSHEYNQFFKKGDDTKPDNNINQKSSNPIKKAFNAFNSFKITSNGGENNDSNNGPFSFAPLKGFSIFAGVLFVICTIGVLLSSNSGIPSDSTNTLDIKKTKSVKTHQSYEKIDSTRFEENTDLSNNQESTNSRRMLSIMNPSSTSYYSNYDFSKDLDLTGKSFQNMKAINTALSHSIELNTNNDKKILFETYKDYSNNNYKTINANERKEILK
jgi:hypothetical protein